MLAVLWLVAGHASFSLPGHFPSPRRQVSVTPVGV